MTRKLSLFCLPLVFALGCSGDDEGTGPEETTDSATDGTSGDTLDTDTSIDSTTGDDGSDSGDTSIAMTDSAGDADATSDASDSGSSSDASDSGSSSDSSVVDAPDASDSAAESATDSGADGDSGDATPPASPEIWAVRVGDGAADLDIIAVSVVVERIRLSDNALVGTLTLPTTASDAGTSHAFTLTGAQSSEGVLTRSRDGHFVTMIGYDAPVGTADVASTGGATYPRVVARIDSSRAIDTSTTTTSGTRPMLSVVSVDGTAYWASSTNGGGIRYLTHGGSGASTAVTATIGARALTIFGDVLYGTSPGGSVRIMEFPSPLPTTTSTPTGLSGTPVDVTYNGIVLTAVDTLYACSEATGIERWTKASGTWSLSKTFAIPPTDTTVGSTVGCTALAGEIIGGAVVLVAVTLDDPLGRIVKIVDDGSASPAVTTMATGTVRRPYRGISFAPKP